jgi:hypothetical protein
VRLGARGTQGLTYQLRLALEPECLKNRTAPPEKIPDEADEAQILLSGSVQL